MTFTCSEVGVGGVTGLTWAERWHSLTYVLKESLQPLRWEWRKEAPGREQGDLRDRREWDRPGRRERLVVHTRVKAERSTAFGVQPLLMDSMGCGMERGAGGDDSRAWGPSTSTGKTGKTASPVTTEEEVSTQCSRSRGGEEARGGVSLSAGEGSDSGHPRLGGTVCPQGPRQWG